MVTRSFERLRRRTVSMRQPATKLPFYFELAAAEHAWPMGADIHEHTPSKAKVPQNVEEQQPIANSNAPRQADGLVRTIESEVIPRLLLALADPISYAPIEPVKSQPTLEHIRELTALTLAYEEPNFEHYASRLRSQGMPLNAIYLQLIAQTARHLGDLWGDDEVEFTDVTVALGRLHKLVRQLSPAFRRDTASGYPLQDYPVASKRILVAPMPGEQHTLGCAIVSEFFAKAGWTVNGWPLIGDESLVSMVANDYFDVVGLSVSCETSLDVIRQLIAALRTASRNRALIVCVGGPAFSDNPALVNTVGADLTAASGDDAVAAAEAAVKRRTQTAN
jgi:MerR family transcriptional regulator, light-induced transcriptional regulator